MYVEVSECGYARGAECEYVIRVAEFMIKLLKK